MDRKSKNLLKYIRGKGKPDDGFLFFYDFTDEYEQVSQLPEQEIMACIRYLEKLGYIRYVCNQDDVSIGFELEHITHNKTEFNWIAFKKYLLDNLIAIIALIISIVSIIMQL